MTEAEISRILALRRGGASTREIARAVFYPRSHITWLLKRRAPELCDIGLPRGRPSPRPALATLLRAAGMSWNEISDRLGYMDASDALKAVRRYTGRPRMRRGQSYSGRSTTWARPA